MDRHQHVATQLLKGLSHDERSVTLVESSFEISASILSAASFVASLLRVVISAGEAPATDERRFKALTPAATPLEAIELVPLISAVTDGVDASPVRLTKKRGKSRRSK